MTIEVTLAPGTARPIRVKMDTTRSISLGLAEAALLSRILAEAVRTLREEAA